MSQQRIHPPEGKEWRDRGNHGKTFDLRLWMSSWSIHIFQRIVWVYYKQMFVPIVSYLPLTYVLCLWSWDGSIQLSPTWAWSGTVHCLWCKRSSAKATSWSASVAWWILASNCPYNYKNWNWSIPVFSRCTHNSLSRGTKTTAIELPCSLLHTIQYAYTLSLLWRPETDWVGVCNFHQYCSYLTGYVVLFLM